MAHSKDWYPKEEAKLLLFAENYVAKIDEATALAGLPPDTFKASKDSTQAFLSNHEKLVEADKTVAELRTTTEETGTVMGHDIRAVSKQLKNTIGMPPKVLELLELVGTSDDPTQCVAAQAPVLKVSPEPSGVQIAYTKYGHNGMELFGCRTGETAFTSLGRFTQNRIHDTRPNLVPGRAETRQYYGVYIDKDQPVGERGPVASLPVEGPLPGPGQNVS